MANKIRFKRGLKANLPTLDIGEPGVCTDTGEIYVGGVSGNIGVAKASALAESTQDITNINKVTAPSKDRFKNYVHVSSQRNPIYLIGDSITEGTATTDFTKDNWGSIVRKAIQREYGNTNYGFCNFNTNIVNTSYPDIKTFHKINRSGFSVHSDPFDGTVFGGARITSNTTGEYVDIVYTGKDAIVVYTADATYGAIINVKVDGVLVGTIDTKVTNGTPNGSFSTPIVVSNYGTHTIRLTNTENKTAQLCGMVYLDDSSQFTPVVYNVGLSSITGSEIPDTLLNQYCDGGMAVLALGVNDQLLSKDIPTFKSKIQRVCDQMLANSGSLIICDFMFSLPPDNAYKVVLADVVKQYSEFIFLDFAKLWFQNTDINKFSKLLDSDGVHPTPQGHEFIGNTILKYMGLPYTKASLRTNDFIEVTNLQGGWVNMGGSFETAGYMKDKEGFVHLKGLIKSGNTAQGSVIFALPYQYSPLKEKIYNVSCGGVYGEIDIATDGSVKVNVAPNNNYLSLDDIKPFKVQ